MTLVRITDWSGDPDMVPPFHVIGDLRGPQSGWDDDNNKYEEVIKLKADEAGLVVEFDSEFSEFFGYCHTIEDAKKLQAIIEDVVPKMHRGEQV